MVAIKDMDMPNSCSECNLTTCKGYDEPWNYCCSVTLTDINLDNDTKPSDCPLVGIGTCKDCKWWDSENNKIGYCNACKHGHCSSTWNIGIYRKTKADFYCADYEKRGSENV